MFAQDLIYANIDADSQDQMFDFLYQVLKSKDLVHDEYKIKIEEREHSYPTGIQLSEIGVAIPHANAEYAKGDAFVIMTSKKGIPFRNMEDGTAVTVKVIIALVFNDKDKHIDHLQSLSALLQNEELLIKISKCSTPNEIYNFLEL